MEPLVRHGILACLHARELGVVARINKTWKKDADHCSRWFDVATAEMHDYCTNEPCVGNELLTRRRCGQVPPLDAIRRCYSQRAFDWKHIYRVIAAYRMYANRRFVFCDPVSGPGASVERLFEQKYIGNPTEIFVGSSNVPRLIVLPLGLAIQPSRQRFMCVSLRTMWTEVYECAGIKTIGSFIVEFLTGMVPDTREWVLDSFPGDDTWSLTCDICHVPLNPIDSIHERKCLACLQVTRPA